MVIVADDLTGACDTAGAVTRHAVVPVHLVGHDVPHVDVAGASVCAFDLDSRSAPASRAVEATVAAVVGVLAAGCDVYLKIDSTLRGHLVPSVAAAAGAFRAVRPGGRVVVCPAFPGRGRVVRESRVVADGVVLESAALVELSRVPGIEVLDAADDADLAAIAEAGDVLWVGSAGLAPHVMAARQSAWVHELVAAPVDLGGGEVERVLVVVGSDQRSSVDGAVEVQHRNDPRVQVLVGDPRVPDFIDAAAAASADVDALVVTGGFTARRLMEQIGIDILMVHGEVEPGMPWSTIAGRPGFVVTKAGGFGGIGALSRGVDFLLDGGMMGR